MKENMVILIVDDDEDDRKLFIESAKEVNAGITFITASDGQEALRLLQDEGTQPPDYIFLDLRMPRVGGKKCLEEIGRDSRLRDVPVFIYTTSKDVKDSIELKNMGAAHFISKPDDPGDIYYILSVVLNDKWEQLNKKGV
jgi:CheY-like chemotaxis protein